ncbi:MAG: DUF4115 domain-containing protein [Methylophilus sp.]|nr:DUF4115 domain-containing protein [Methylophilus sp.]
MAKKAQNNTETTTGVSDEVVTTQPPHLEEPLTESVQTHVAVTHSECGGALKLHREKLGLSLHDIASQLRLSVKQINAIEMDLYEKLPQPSIVRGFIRNYAKILKIDAEPIVQAYNALVPNTQPQSFTVKSSANSSIVIGENKNSFSIKLFTGVLIFFGLIVSLFFYYKQNIKPSTPEEITSLNAQVLAQKNQVEPASAPVEFALPAAERQPETTENALTPDAPADTTSTTPVILPEQNTLTTPTDKISTIATNVNPPVSTETPAAEPKPQIESAPPAIPNNKTELHIQANEETWINITDTHGNEIYSKVIPMGSSETFSAKPPLNVVVGNATGTALTVNGQAYDLAAHTRKKVARFTLN